MVKKPTNIKEQLERDEGRRNRMYVDTTGHHTIGIGCNLETFTFPDHIVDAIFDIQISDVRHDIASHIPWAYMLDDVRHAVLMNLCFNMGISTLLTFKNTLN